MTEEFDTILFDAGGTLIDLSPSRQAVFAGVLAKHGLRVDESTVAKAMAKADRIYDDKFAHLDGTDEEWYWAEYDQFILKDLGFEGDSKTFTKDLEKEFDRIIPDVSHWRAYEDVRPTLEALRSRGFKIGLVSNATDLVRRVFDHLELTKYFDFMVLSDEVGIRKPRPGIFMKALESADTTANRTLYVGDKLNVDVVAATRVGINSVLLDREDVFPNAMCIRARDLGFIAAYS